MRFWYGCICGGVGGTRPIWDGATVVTEIGEEGSRGRRQLRDPLSLGAGVPSDRICRVGSLGADATLGARDPKAAHQGTKGLLVPHPSGASCRPAVRLLLGTTEAGGALSQWAAQRFVIVRHVHARQRLLIGLLVGGTIGNPRSGRDMGLVLPDEHFPTSILLGKKKHLLTGDHPGEVGIAGLGRALVHVPDFQKTARFAHPVPSAPGRGSASLRGCHHACAGALLAAARGPSKS